MATWWAPWTWFGEGRSHADNFIRNVGAAPGKFGLPVNERTALQLSAVLCAVRVIAEGVAQVPLKVYRETEEGKRTVRSPAKDHSAYSVLHRRPNAWMTSFEWRELMTLHAVLLGEGYSIIHRVSGKIDELIPVHPSAVQILFDGHDVRYRISVDGVSADYERNEVFRLRGPSMDGVTALPIVRMAASAIGLAQMLERSQSELQSNGARPSGILKLKDGQLNPEKKTEISDAWRKKFGPGGGGGVAVLDANWDFLSMTMTAVDQQHLESRKMQVEEIGRAFRVLPIMMMQSDKAATYASAEQMFMAHIIHTLGPWLDRWEQAIDRDLLDGEEAVYAHFQVKGLMRGAAKDQAEYYAKALGSGGAAGWMTQNEVRALEDMDPVDGGDELFRGAQNDTGASSDADDPAAPDGTTQEDE
ncbi:phage portal protein [Rhizobium rhizosphaerae]|uniref:Phage portal protein n=1 Tax=Xaviernesmea rhizosphaerae TaxID=1672749 RepID=A0A1Q9AMN9_9HYPH|nr:phage portal protein [Xaviernesmea rhizosphaerae]OLP56662.1 phage portal protein [Xaviernesmea rhizosphaerae]